MLKADKSYVDNQDATKVSKTGDETIQGVKTFESSPIVPTPTQTTEAATKGYVDNGLVLTADKSYVDNQGATPNNVPGRIVSRDDRGNTSVNELICVNLRVPKTLPVNKTSGEWYLYIV